MPFPHKLARRLALLNDPAIAAAVVVLAAVAAISSCERPVAPTGVDNSTPVASVTVSPASASVPVGQTVQLTATPLDSTGSPLVGRTVSWSTSNPTVAAVDG